MPYISEKNNIVYVKFDEFDYSLDFYDKIKNSFLKIMKFKENLNWDRKITLIYEPPTLSSSILGLLIRIKRELNIDLHVIIKDAGKDNKIIDLLSSLDLIHYLKVKTESEIMNMDIETKDVLPNKYDKYRIDF